jgi:ABC-type uncharacterized transport system involved in gliding motility auxiliary subunit
MSDLQYSDRAERADRMITTLSGWAALVCLILGFHRWAATSWNMDWWGKAGLIMGAGLGLMWLWGHAPAIWRNLRAWARAGGLNSALVAVTLVVALIIVNTLVRRRVEVKFDLTKNQRFTLSPRTREILNKLDQPVKATLFNISGRGNGERAADLFRQYADLSPKFQWTQVNPLTKPEAYLAKRPSARLAFPEFGAVLEYKNNRQEITDYTEKEVTSAILKMTRTVERKIGFISGHGEPGIDSGAPQGASIQGLVQGLRESQWTLEKLDLLKKGAKAPNPDEIAVVVIPGPTRPLAADEEKLLTEYLNKGGKVLLMLTRDGPDFAKLLTAWGIKANKDLVVGFRDGGLLLATAAQEDHLATRPVRGARLISFPMRSISKSGTPAGVTVTELVKSEPDARHVTNYAGQRDLTAAVENAKTASVPLVIMAEKSIGTGDAAKKARLIVLGDNEIVSDQLLQVPGFANADLGSGLINYLGEEEALVSIPPKEENTEQAFVLPEQLVLFRMIHLADFPLLALALAVFVYWKRR